MMERYLFFSFLITNELRFLAGLFLLTKLRDFSLRKKMWILAALGECAVTVCGAKGWSAAGLIAAELVLAAAVLWYSQREQLRMCLFLLFFYEIGVALWEFLLSAGLGIVFRSGRFLDSRLPESLAGIWLVRLWLAVSVLILERRFLREKRQAFWLAAAPAMLGLFCTVALSEQTILPVDDDRLGTWVILSMLLLFSILFYRMGRQRDMEAEIARLRAEQTEILERDFQALSRTYASHAKLYHDLHNHMDVICHSLEQGETDAALQYCKDLRAPIREITKTVWTGDRSVDYLISSKLALAERMQVQTRVNVEYPRNTNIRNVDLTTVLGNLLDNAVEGVRTAPDHLRFLHLTIRRINDMLIIKVENGCGKAPVLEAGTWKTSKNDEALHGWGLKSVCTAAKRYDGAVDTDYEDGIFRAVVTLCYDPVERK